MEFSTEQQAICLLAGRYGAKYSFVPYTEVVDLQQITPHDADSVTTDSTSVNPMTFIRDGKFGNP